MPDGLDILGLNIARELFENGFEVIAVDKNKGVLQRIKDFSTRAVIADGTDKEVMELIGIQEDDTGIISFGEDLAASTLTTLFLIICRLPTVISSARWPPQQFPGEDTGGNIVAEPVSH